MLNLAITMPPPMLTNETSINALLGATIGYRGVAVGQGGL